MTFSSSAVNKPTATKEYSSQDKLDLHLGSHSSPQVLYVPSSAPTYLPSVHCTTVKYSNSNNASFGRSRPLPLQRLGSPSGSEKISAAVSYILISQFDTFNEVKFHTFSGIRILFRPPSQHFNSRQPCCFLYACSHPYESLFHGVLRYRQCLLCLISLLLI